MRNSLSAIDSTSANRDFIPEAATLRIKVNLPRTIVIMLGIMGWVLGGEDEWRSPL